MQNPLSGSKEKKKVGSQKSTNYKHFNLSTFQHQQNCFYIIYIISILFDLGVRKRIILKNFLNNSLFKIENCYKIISINSYKELFAMNMIKEKNGQTLVVKPIGRIDVNTAAEFEHEVNAELEDIIDFTLDLDKVVYISSIGLRVILEFQKRMDNQGKMVIKNVRPEIMELFELIGFDKILNIA